MPTKNRREIKRRGAACPTINTEHRDVLVGADYAKDLYEFLTNNSIRALLPVEAGVGLCLIGFANDTNLDTLKQLIKDWKKII